MKVKSTPSLRPKTWSLTISSCQCLKDICCVSKCACKVCGRCLGSICKVYEGGLINDLKNEDDHKNE